MGCRLCDLNCIKWLRRLWCFAKMKYSSPTEPDHWVSWFCFTFVTYNLVPILYFLFINLPYNLKECKSSTPSWIVPTGQQLDQLTCIGTSSPPLPPKPTHLHKHSSCKYFSHHHTFHRFVLGGFQNICFFGFAFSFLWILGIRWQSFIMASWRPSQKILCLCDHDTVTLWHSDTLWPWQCDGPDYCREPITDGIPATI